jgi:CBS domain-containing protein
MSATLPPEDARPDSEAAEDRDAVSRALASQDPLTTPLSSLVRRPPVTCLADEMVNVALERMRAQNVGSILVVDPAGGPVGMFTMKDLRDRVAIGNCDMRQPMSRVMTPNPFCLEDALPSFEAALAMARRSIHHVVITHQGVVRGVISEKDLFALQQVGVARIASHLSIAEDLPTLQRLAEDTRRLARNLMAQGVGAEPLTRLISELNDQLTQRILDLAFTGSGLEDADWCWLALGSEGR